MVTDNLLEHFLTVLMVKMLFLTASLSIFHFNSCPLSLVLPPCTLAKSLAPFLDNFLVGTVRLLFVPHKAISSPGQTSLVPSASPHRALALSPLGYVPTRTDTTCSRNHLLCATVSASEQASLLVEDTVGCQPAAVATDAAFSGSA